MIILTDFAERALKRISPIYEDSEFIRHFFNGISYDEVRAAFKNLREQSFIETVGELGIEYQEHKYSLDPRPDLTLEERRRRLGIRAQIHRPINPARLEKAIYEKDPGYIWICSNQLTAQGYKDVLDFLMEEKPAHLTLGNYIHIITYIGDPTGKEEVEPPILRPDTPFVPPTDEDKKKYPRIFAGVIPVITGSAKIRTEPNVRPAVNRVYAGVMQNVDGIAKIENARPRDEVQTIRVGTAFGIGGEIHIGCVDERPQHYIRENATAVLAVSSFAIARGAFDYLPPDFDIDTMPYDTVKIFFDFPISRHRRVRGVALPNARQDLTKQEIQSVGQYAVDNKLITNAAGELASSVTKAALKTRETTRMF